MSATSGLDHEDEKPVVQSAHINLKVRIHQNGQEVFFRINRNTQLKKLMDACCEKQSLEMKGVKFSYEGKSFRAEQTPDELKMEEGDEIDVFMDQLGGGGGIQLQPTF